MTDLVIRISASADQFTDALDDIKKQTAGLDENLANVAKVSAVAFAALSAEAFLAAKAFQENQIASAELTTSLQNQGIFTTELRQKYLDMASAVQEATGVSDESIVSGQALLQSQIGQTEITESLTKAVVDLAAAKKIDLVSAFDLVGKATNGNVVGFNKMGIEIDATKSKSEILAQVTRELSARFDGQAEAATSGLGAMKLLTTAVGELQEGIGQRLAPALEFAIKGLTGFVNALKDNKPLLDIIVAIGVGAGVVSGLGVAVGVAGSAFLAFRAALLAAGIATNAMTVATSVLAGATGIGALVAIGTYVALNWETIWPRMQQIFKAFTDNIGSLAGGLGDLLMGIFTLDTDRIQQGLNKIKEAFLKTYEEAAAAVPQVTKAEEKQEADRAKIAANQRAREEDEAKRKRAREQADLQATQLEAEGASKKMISLKKEEAAILKAIEDDKNAAIRDSLEQRLETVREMQEQEMANEQEQRRAYREMQFEETEEYEALSAEQRKTFQDTQLTELQGQIMTEQQYREKAAQDKLQQQIKTQNQFMANEKKFGKEYAELQRFMNTESVQGFKSATGELVALQGSSNKTLFAIGKSAALAQIAIKTTESAMNIYAGFSTIPIIGPALGIAGAAAAIAYGAEQFKKVQSTPPPVGAFDGGLIEGGVRGVDSVPAFLSPGELVAPARNFDEVVNAVAAQRARGKNGGSDIQTVDQGEVRIVLELSDELAAFVEARILERQNLNISTLGAA